MTREKDAEKVGGFYTAGEFDLGRMISGMPKGTKYLELGRSCILKSYRARPGTMQLLWKGLLRKNSQVVVTSSSAVLGNPPDILCGFAPLRDLS